jgi:hypothetical protein
MFEFLVETDAASDTTNVIARRVGVAYAARRRSEQGPTSHLTPRETS